MLLPLAFFLVFAFLFGALVVFLEPCYHKDECMFVDLVNSAYFTVVTMTTTGYGDQVPRLQATRALAVLVMLFGSLFLAMPLSIIGSVFFEAYHAHERAAGGGGGGGGAAGRAARRRRARDDRAAFRAHAKHLAATVAALFLKTDQGEGGVATAGGCKEGAAAAQEEEEGRAERVVLAITGLCARAARLEREPVAADRAALHALAVKAAAALYAARAEATALLHRRRRCRRRWSQEEEEEGLLAECPPPCNFSGGAAGDDGARGLSSDKNDRAAQQEQLAWGFLSGLGACHRALEDLALGVQFHTGLFVPEAGAAAGLKKYIPPTKSSRAEGDAGPAAAAPAEPAPLDDPPAAAAPAAPVSSELEGSTDHSSRQLVGHASLRSPGAWSLRSPGGGGGRLRRQVSDRARAALLLRKGAAARLARKMAAVRGDELQYKFFLEVVETKRRVAARDRAWLLLEVPASSKSARRLEYLLVACILLSLAVLGLESMPELKRYGEGSRFCGQALALYCGDKADPALDPGCFVVAGDGEEGGGEASEWVGAEPLGFGCEGAGCFAGGRNFGAAGSPLTCEGWNSGEEEEGGWPRPFQTQAMLGDSQPFWMFMRTARANQAHDPCYRPECSNDQKFFFDASNWWFPIETALALVFTVELGLRIWAARSRRVFLRWSTWLDVAAVAPYYLDVAAQLRGGDWDFSVGPTKSGVVALLRTAKVIRVFKVTRHHPGAAVLVETLLLAGHQLLVPLFFLVLFLLVGGGLAFLFDSGRACFAHDADGSCAALGLDPLEEALHAEGTRLVVNAAGELANLADLTQALWLTAVTATSVGYGVTLPASIPAKLVMATVMVLGMVYLAMPLAIVGTHFGRAYDRCHKLHRLVGAAARDFLGQGEEEQEEEAAEGGGCPSCAVGGARPCGCEGSRRTPRPTAGSEGARGAQRRGARRRRSSVGQALARQVSNVRRALEEPGAAAARAAAARARRGRAARTRRALRRLLALGARLDAAAAGVRGVLAAAGLLRAWLRRARGRVAARAGAAAAGGRAAAATTGAVALADGEVKDLPDSPMDGPHGRSSVVRFAGKEAKGQGVGVRKRSSTNQSKVYLAPVVESNHHDVPEVTSSENRSDPLEKGQSNDYEHPAPSCESTWTTAPLADGHMKCVEEEDSELTLQSCSSSWGGRRITAAGDNQSSSSPRSKPYLPISKQKKTDDTCGNAAASSCSATAPEEAEEEEEKCLLALIQDHCNEIIAVTTEFGELHMELCSIFESWME